MVIRALYVLVLVAAVLAMALGYGSLGRYAFKPIPIVRDAIIR